MEYTLAFADKDCSSNVYSTANRMLHLALLLLLGRPALARTPTPAPGLWAAPASAMFDPREAPEVRGMMFNANWGDLQPSPDIFEWGEFDKHVNKNKYRKINYLLFPSC